MLAPKKVALPHKNSKQSWWTFNLLEATKTFFKNQFRGPPNLFFFDFSNFQIFPNMFERKLYVD